MGDFDSRNTPSLRSIVRVIGAALVVIGVKLVLIVAGGAITIVLSCLVLFFVLGPHAPSDRQMINQYAEQRAEFDRLAEMFTVENELALVYPDSGRCETVERQLIEPRENEKCDEYVQLFRSLEIGWAYVDGAPVYLRVYSEGLLPGTRKGFVYAPDATALRGVIQTDTKYHGQSGVKNVPLGDDWYIFLD